VPPPFLALGALVDGRYRLKAILGQGGMGVVYEAEDLRLARRVALKIMRDEQDDSPGERLFREARAAARADHPAIVTTYGYGDDPQGETLLARIERTGPLPHELTVRVGLEMTDALAAVHAAGVVHRDLKPSNVFLASRGRRVDEVKLLDFGVAKQLDLQTLTATGQIYGTPMYMAPEQLTDAKRADRRADIYALGAVLFECLSGKPPFDAPDMPTLASEIMFKAPRDPEAMRGSAIPAGLLAIVRRCMQKRPQERYAEAGAVGSALAALG
jgi:eukaryotic-like serine/threonine-protein kinase